MAPHDGTDPALLNTPVPLEGDGTELLGMVIDGRYRLDSPLGRGGMGLVFRATHVGMRRMVAVKILHPSLAASPDVRSRFEREALAVGKVDHPNCVATYDVGRLPDGALYLAMELLEGKSLADILENEGQLSPGRALHILAHVLRGLSGIHAAGLIHRDIKPENIFLVRQGDDVEFAKILDFGIAKPMSGELSDDGVRLTQAGMAFGTPIYMAPEQALGNPMDGRADIYAAAVICYEMLVGQPPFYSEDKLEVMSMHTAKPVPPMRNRLIRGGKPVPSSLEKLILRGLTKKPGDRYASAEVFLAAVEDAASTPDGGQTAVEFDRPGRDTGAQPLVDTDGAFTLDDNGFAITNAIEEALAISPTNPKAKPLRTPERGAAALPRDVPRIVTKVGVPPPGPADLPTAPRPSRAGGFGAGGPMTAAAGEAAFAGFSSDDRRAKARASRTKKLMIYGGIAAVAIIIGVTIAVVTAPGNSGIDRNTPAGQASEMLQRGDYNGAIAHLSKPDMADDANAQLVLGHAYSAKNEAPNAINAYRRALAINTSLQKNSDLRANLRTMAADKNPEIVQNAFDVWVGHTDDASAKELLLKAVVSPTSADRRAAARNVLDLHKLGDELVRVKSYSLDLTDQQLTCPQRGEAVGKLRAIGNPAAIPALERAMELKGKQGAMKGKLLNACFIEEARAARGVLNSLKKK